MEARQGAGLAVPQFRKFGPVMLRSGSSEWQAPHAPYTRCHLVGLPVSAFADAKRRNAPANTLVLIMANRFMCSSILSRRTDI